jgi:hypothetical protein
MNPLALFVLLLQVGALAVFILAASKYSQAKVELVAVGLSCLSLASLLGGGNALINH